eukprot:6971066-Pyramimonas_sp.AAC.1
MTLRERKRKTKVDGLPPAPSYVLEFQQVVRALIFFPVIFDLIPARRLNLSSIGYLLLPRSMWAGSAVPSHLGAS